MTINDFNVSEMEEAAKKIKAEALTGLKHNTADMSCENILKEIERVLEILEEAALMNKSPYSLLSSE